MLSATQKPTRRWAFFVDPRMPLMTSTEPYIDRVIRFFTTGLWQMEPEEYRGAMRYVVKYLQIMVMVLRNFWEDQCLLRASALSFTTILSFVPFFALAFSILKGFGVQNKVEPLILQQLAGGYQEILEKIITYINNTNMTSVGAIGLAALIVTVISLLGSIEEAFNMIWGVPETRTLYRKFSDYLSVVVSGPLLLLAAVSITTTLRSQGLVQWLVEMHYVGDVLLFLFTLIPYLSIWIALIFLYTFVPNTHVRFKSALIGGVLAGTLWQLVQWGYITFQFGVAKYNAIYGTIALVPIFMFWIYTSWLIVLFGVEIVCAHQNIRTFRRELHSPSLSHGLKELLALAILRIITETFYKGERGWTVERLAEKLNVPVRLAREILGQLTETGYLAPTAGEEQTYLPAREPATIEVHDVLAKMRDRGVKTSLLRISIEETQLQDILARLDRATAEALQGMTLRDIAGRASTAAGGPGEAKAGETRSR